jgi:hypothetical protein
MLNCSPFFLLRLHPAAFECAGNPRAMMISLSEPPQPDIQWDCQQAQQSSETQNFNNSFIQGYGLCKILWILGEEWAEPQMRVTTFGGFKIHETACLHHNTGTTMWNCKNDANGIRTRPQTPPLLPLLSANHQPTPVLWLWLLVICILISTTKFPRHTIATNFLHKLQRYIKHKQEGTIG